MTCVSATVATTEPLTTCCFVLRISRLSRTKTWPAALRLPHFNSDPRQPQRGRFLRHGLRRVRRNRQRLTDFSRLAAASFAWPWTTRTRTTPRCATARSMGDRNPARFPDWGGDPRFWKRYTDEVWICLLAEKLGGGEAGDDVYRPSASATPSSRTARWSRPPCKRTSSRASRT